MIFNVHIFSTHFSGRLHRNFSRSYFMKNKLLLTTALVGVAFAMPTMAAEEWDGKTSYLIPQGETLVLEENSLVENITNNADGIGGALSTSKPKNGVENPGTLIVKSGTVFKNNTAKYDGGAIANFGVLDIDGATFEANKSQTETTDSQPVGGGAISLGIDSKTTIKNTKFVNNETGFNGGASGPDVLSTTGILPMVRMKITV